MTSKNVPITFTWRALVQDHDWPKRSTEKKSPSRVQINSVAFVLERFADADGKNVYPSVGTVSDLAGVGSATVRSVLKLMRAESFLRVDGTGRHGTVKYRLVYPSLSSQIDSAGSISESKSRQTTNRTESPSADSTPDGLLVAPSATTQPAVSIPIVKGDLVVLYRKTLEFLRPFLERGERVSFPEERTLAQKFYDDGLNDLWQSLTRISVFSDMIRFMGSTSENFFPYELVVSVLSGECKDKRQITFVINNLDWNRELILSDGLSYLHDFYCQWRSECESEWVFPDGDRNDGKLVSDLGWVKRWDDGRDLYFIEKFMRCINESRDRVMAIRANAQKVSVSATNTGSDASIVEKIVSTVSEKVVERW